MTNTSVIRCLFFFFLTTLLSSVSCHAFVFVERTSTPARMTSLLTTKQTVLAAAHHRNAQDQENYFLKDFVLYNGEVLDPYKILKVDRQADSAAIKQAYRALSRLYHPDAARQRDILPGACDNQEQVREHWERINYSYALLNNPTRRRKYDRHEALADPGRALRRAAAQAAWKGVSALGKGLWDVTSATVSNIANKTAAQETRANKKKNQQEAAAASTVVEYKSHTGVGASWENKNNSLLPVDLDNGANDSEGETKVPIIVPVKE